MIRGENALLILYQSKKRLFYKAFLLLMVANSLVALNPFLLRTPSIGNGRFFLPFLFLSLSIYLKFNVRMDLATFSASKEAEVKNSLFETVQRQKEPFFTSHPQGALIYLFNSDFQSLRDYIYFGIFSPLNLITLLFPSLFISLILSWQLTLLAFTPLALIPLMMSLAFGTIEKKRTWVHKKLESWNQFSLEIIRGLRGLKHPSAQISLRNLGEKLSDELQAASFPLHLLECSFIPLVNILGRAISLCVILLSISLAKQNILPLIDLLSFLWIQGNLLTPVLFLGWTIPILKKGKTSTHRIREILDNDTRKDEPESILPSLPPSISLKGVFFRYEKGGTLVFEDLSLEVPPHSLIGIAGPIGSGKTTLCRILLDQYPLEGGEVKIGGLTIKDRPRLFFQKSIAYVEQNPFLFTGTLRENITIGSPYASEKEIKKAIEEACLEKDFSDLPKSLDTIVGERGSTLSGGQRKRIALARAILVKRPILLLDDLFTSIDSVTGRSIFEMVKKKKSSQTILVFTNQVTLLQECDHVFFLSQGKVLEEGSPSEVFSKKEGPFHDLKSIYETIHPKID